VKRLIEIFVSKFHWFIILNVAMNSYFDYSDIQAKIEEVLKEEEPVKTQLESVNKKMKLAESFKKDLANIKSRIEEIAQKIELLQKQLPNTISDSEILDFFAEEAKITNIKNLSMQPNEEESRGFFFAKEYEISAKATFLQFLILFERIGNNQRLLNIASLNMERKNDDQKGRYTILQMRSTLEVFRYNSSYKEDRGIDDIEARFNEGNKASGKGPKAKKGKEYEPEVL